jgi:hypothetical protein
MAFSSHYSTTMTVVFIEPINVDPVKQTLKIFCLFLYMVNAFILRNTRYSVTNLRSPSEEIFGLCPQRPFETCYVDDFSAPTQHCLTEASLILYLVVVGVVNGQQVVVAGVHVADDELDPFEAVHPLNQVTERLKGGVRAARFEAETPAVGGGAV